MAGSLMVWADLGPKFIDRFLRQTLIIEMTQVLHRWRWRTALRQHLCTAAHPWDAAIFKVQHWLQAGECKNLNLATLAVSGKA